MKQYHNFCVSPYLTLLLLLLAFVLTSSPALSETKSIQLSVSVTGIKGKPLDNVLRVLTLDREKNSNNISSKKIKIWFRQADNEIRTALQPYGYYQPKLTKKLANSNNLWEATFNVELGPETLITELSIIMVGAEEPSSNVQTRINQFKPKVGEALNHLHYSASKEALYQALFDEGYLDASFERATIEVSKLNNQAKIYLEINPGPRYFFGPTTVKQSILSDQVIEKWISIPEGKPFQTQAVINQKLTLDNSGYFSRVEPLPKKEEAVNYHIPIFIDTLPVKPRKYRLGVGYGTDTGPRVSAGIEFRRINNRGHRLNTSSLISPVLQNLDMRYRIPFKQVRSDEITLSTRAEREEIEENVSERFVFGLERAENWRSLRRRLYIENSIETFENAQQNEFARIVTPGFEFSRQQLDNALFPRKGYRWLVDMRVASNDIQSTVNFQRFLLTGGLIRPLLEQSRFILRGEIGLLKTDSFSEVPPPQRFYAGGARNVRGYAYRKLGAQDTAGSPTGGSSYVFASAEIDTLVYKNFGLAIFYDTGSLSEVGSLSTSGNNDGFGTELKPSAGIGFRWKSPVGVLRIDFATPLKEKDKHFQVHFSIGPDL